MFAKKSIVATLALLVSQNVVLSAPTLGLLFGKGDECAMFNKFGAKLEFISGFLGDFGISPNCNKEVSVCDRYGNECDGSDYDSSKCKASNCGSYQEENHGSEYSSGSESHDSKYSGEGNSHNSEYSGEGDSSYSGKGDSDYSGEGNSGHSGDEKVAKYGSPRSSESKKHGSSGGGPHGH